MSQRITEKLRRHGHQAYWVGGCVRDALLGRRCKDRDVTTSAHPDQVAELFPGARRVGARFGVMVVPDGGDSVEVATFRRDHIYRDGRRPQAVSFTSDAREDVLRRDFTVNGILQDPSSRECIDYVGGLDDLRRKLVRAIGSPRRRFEEDRLRMLRAVRFAASLDFRIEAATMEAIRELAPGIAAVAPERVRNELGRILTEGGARLGFELLAETGLLGLLLPEVAALRGVAQPPEFHPEGDVWEHTLLMLDQLRKPSEPLAWGVLLHDVGKPDTFRHDDRIRFHGHVERGLELTRGICARLRVSHADWDRILALVGNHMKFMDVQRMRPGRLRRFLEQPHFEEHLELHRLDCLASHGRLDNHAVAAERFERLAEQEPTPRLLTGNDLKRAGYAPGPVFGTILALVEELQLEGQLADRDQALAFVRERFPLGAARHDAAERSGSGLRVAAILQQSVDRTPAGTVGPQEQEHEAIQHGELSAVEERQESVFGMRHEISRRHHPRTDEGHPAGPKSDQDQDSPDQLD